MAYLALNVSLYKTDGTLITTVPTGMSAYYGQGVSNPTTSMRIGSNPTRVVVNNNQTVYFNFKLSFPSGATYTFDHWHCECNGATANSSTNPFASTASRNWTFTTPRTGTYIDAYIKAYLEFPHTVSYSKNSAAVIGQDIPDDTVTPGNSVTLPNPTGWSRSGYTFDSWNTSSDGSGTKYLSGATFTPEGDTTLYAQWVALQNYTVEFSKNSTSVIGTDISPISSYAGSTVTLPNPTGWSRPGYTFDSWNTVDDGSGVKYNANAGFTLSVPYTLLYAQWKSIKPQAYEVYFEKNNANVIGEQISPALVLAGQYLVVSAPTEWRVNGGTFKQWNTSSDGTGASYTPGATLTPSKDMVLYAIWDFSEENQGSYRTSPPCDHAWNFTTDPNDIYTDEYTQYRLHFITDYNQGPVEITYQYRNFPPPTGQVSSSTEEINNQSYTIVYFPSYFTGYASGSLYYYRKINKTGEVYSYSNATDIETFTFSAPAIAHCEFLGWYSQPENKEYPAPANPSQTTLTMLLTSSRQTTWGELRRYLKYNLWLRTDYSVSGSRYYSYNICLRYQGVRVKVLLNANGGNVSPWYIYTRYLAKYSLYSNLPTPVYSGYSFAGWYTSETGGTQVTDDTICYQYDTHILYAHWTSTTAHTLTFDATGGTVTTTSKTLTEGAPYGQLPTPTYANHSFQGWWTASSGGEQVSANTLMGDSDVTVYAHWDDTKIDIEFIGNGGIPTTQTKGYVAGVPYGILPTVARDSFLFDGWWTASEGGTQIFTSTIVDATIVTLYAHWRVPQSFDGIIWAYEKESQRDEFLLQ